MNKLSGFHLLFGRLALEPVSDFHGKVAKRAALTMIYMAKRMIETGNLEIIKYQSDDEKSILEAIKKDPNWDVFTNDNAISSYRNSLKNSITYVCHHRSEFTGYIRAILDEGLAIYISELYVVPEWRNQKVGRSLLAKIKEAFPELTVYALSDEDAYYEKLGFKKIGSVFKI